jgi:hypothetical protein
MENLLALLFSVLSFLPSYGSQGIQQLQLWKTSGGNVQVATTTGSIRVPFLANCDTIDTDANGVMSCGTDSGGAGTIDGTGVANTIAVWSDADTLTATSGNPLYATRFTATSSTATSTFPVISSSVIRDTLGFTYGDIDAHTLNDAGSNMALNFAAFNALELSGYDCSGNTNGGALTVDGAGVLSCTNDDSGGGGASFGQAWEIGGNGFAGFLAPTTTQKLWLGQASSTLFSAHQAYFGATATSSFSSAGVLTLASNLFMPASSKIDFGSGDVTITDGGGNNLTVDGGTLTVTNGDLIVGTNGRTLELQGSGIRQTSDNDGAWTISGLGNGTNHSVTWNLDDNAFPTITSSASTIDWSALNLTTTGTITAGNLIANSSTATSSVAAGGFAVGTTTPHATSLLTVGTSSPLLVIDRVTGKTGFGGVNSSPSRWAFGTGTNLNINPNINLLVQDASDARAAVCTSDDCIALKSTAGTLGLFGFDYAGGVPLSIVMQEFGGGIDMGTATFTEISNGTNPTANDVGELAHDTTDNQLILDDFVVATAVQKIWSATIASTSPALISGGLMKIPTQLDGYTITAIRCSVQGGTSQVIAVEDESANSSEDITCGTSVTSDDGSITNATYTAAEESYIDFGATSGAVDYVAISVFGTWTRE